MFYLVTDADGCYFGVYYDLKCLFIKRMMINQKQSTLLTRDYIDKQNFQTSKYSDITKDQCLMESIKCVNIIEV